MEIIMMIGNIGTGKTTVSKNYAEKGYMIWNSDTVGYMLTLSNERYNQKYFMIKGLEFEFIKKAMEYNINFVIDKTNISQEKRQLEIDYIKSISRRIGREYKITAIDFGAGTEFDFQARIKDNKGIKTEIWREVFNRFQKQYEKPELSEGFDMILNGRINNVVRVLKEAEC